MPFPLILDGTNSNKPHGTNVYAKNKVVDELRQNIRNEDGFQRVVDEADLTSIYGALGNTHLVGVIDTPTEIVCFLTSGDLTAKQSHILKLEVFEDYTVNITPVLATHDIIVNVPQNGLNFTAEHPIQGTFTYNAHHELIISWVEGVKDGANPLRSLNTDDIPFPMTGHYPTTPSDIEFLNSNKPLSIPTMELEQVSQSGGSLFNGVYTLFVAYSDNEGNRTNFIGTMNPVTIYFENSGQVYNDVYDADINTLTGKSIIINLDNLSSLYSYVTIGVLYTSNGSTTGYSKTFPYTSSLTQTVVNNLSDFEQLAVSDIVVDNVIYDKVNAITKYANQLIIGNLTTRGLDDLQLLANDITVEYEAYSVKTTLDVPVQGSGDINITYKDDKMIVESRTFQPNEVYAFYIQPLYIDGTVGDLFHIPGREAINNNYRLSDDDVYVNEDALISEGSSVTTSEIVYVDSVVPGSEKFKEDVKLGDEVKVFQVRSTAESGGSGRLGFWENETETYPNSPSFGVLAGEKVRHHKMPDFNDYWTTALAAVSNTAALRLTFDLSTFRPIAEIANQIQGYRIHTAKRTGYNNLVVDEALINNVSKRLDDSFYPCVNSNHFNVDYGTEFKMTYQAIRDLATDPDTSIRPNRFILNAPTTQKYNNPLVYDYVKLENLLEFEYELREVDTFVFSTMLNFGTALSPNYTSNLQVNTLRYAGGDDYVKDIIRYAPNYRVEKTFYAALDGLYDDNLDMSNAADGIYFRSDRQLQLLTDELNGFATSYTFGEVNLFDSIESPSKHSVSGKVVMMKYRTDAYFAFLNQETSIVAEFIGDINTVTDVEVSGDSYIAGVAIRLTTVSTLSLSLFPYCSPINFELRTPGQGVVTIQNILYPDEDNYFAPNPICYDDLDLRWDGSPVSGPNGYQTAEWKWLARAYIITNYWGEGQRSVKADWAKLNDWKGGIIFNPFGNFINEFPFRVHRSLPQTTESTFEAWNVFTSTNYQEMDNSKGQVQTLDDGDKVLYVRQEYALFAYQVKDALEALNESISLQSTGIFHNRPEEIITDTHGYIGSNSRFNSLMTPFGYFVIDVVKKNIYKVNGVEGKDISGGIKAFMNIHMFDVLKNPYVEGDYVLAYSDIEKAVLFTCRDNKTAVTTGIEINDSFTLSYDIYENAFLSFHSYIPNMYGATRNALFSIINSTVDHTFGIYRHNYKDTKCLFYYDKVDTEPRVPYPDYIDLLFNKGDSLESQENKKLDFAIWNTETRLVDTPHGLISINQNKTVDEIVVYSDTQCSEIIPINVEERDWYDTDSGRNIQNIWTQKDILDAVDDPTAVIIDEDYAINVSNLSQKDFYDMSTFIGTFAVLRLIHHNSYIPVTFKQYEQYINMATINFKPNNR